MSTVFSGYEFSFSVQVNARQLHLFGKKLNTCFYTWLDSYVIGSSLTTDFSYSFKKTAMEEKHISLLMLKNTKTDSISNDDGNKARV